MKQFTHRKTFEIKPIPLVVGKLSWKVRRSKKYKLIVAPDGFSAVLEFNRGTSLPEITVAADCEVAP